MWVTEVGIFYSRFWGRRHVDSARDHGSGKDGPIVDRISQFRNHRPEPVTNRSYRPGRPFRQHWGRARARLWHGKSIVHLANTPLPLGSATPRREPRHCALNLPLQIRCLLNATPPPHLRTRVRSIKGINYVRWWVPLRSYIQSSEGCIDAM